MLPVTVEGARAAMERTTTHPLLRGLVADFGAEIPADADLAARLDWLVSFSERWDYRAGRERNLVETPTFDPALAERILLTASALGLVEEARPQRSDYDHVLVLGGLARACFARPLYAARLLSGGVDVTSVIALGGYRPLRGDELGLAARIGAEDVEDEFEAMDAGVRRAFDLDEPVAERGHRSDVVGASWSVREYRGRESEAISVVAAPSTEPGTRRANTPDTYRWFATELARLEPGQRLLLVTSDIYVPYQHADALRMLALPYGVEVETVGIRPGTLDARLAQAFLPHNYLQEMRSTFMAFRNLDAAIAERVGA